MSFMMYGNGGGIDEVIAEIANPTKVYNSIIVAFLDLVKTSPKGTYSVEDLSLKYYGFDDRIGKDVYMIVSNRCGKENYIKKYGHPCFVRYLVQLDE